MVSEMGIYEKYGMSRVFYSSINMPVLHLALST